MPKRWWITFPIAIAVLALLRPTPTILIVAALAWIVWAVFTYRASEVAPTNSPRYRAGCGIALLGSVAFGASVLFALAHSMDPIGPEAPWFPFTFLGGLVAMLIGIVIVVTRRT